MDFTAGLFEHDVEFDNSARVAARQAVSVAHKRAKDRFGAFLAAASAGDFHQRWALVEDELADVVADTVEEYGGDHEGVLAAVTSVLAAGGFCDDCRKWKSGPKKGCECGSAKGTEPSAEMDDSDGDEESSDSGTIAKVAFGEPHVEPIPHQGPSPHAPATPADPSHPAYNADHIHVCQGCGTTYSDPDGRTPCHNCGEIYHDGQGAVPHVARWTVITSDDTTGLGGPSPKMDKKEWKPNALNDKGNLKPIKTEGKDSPNPTEKQDISDVPDHTKDPLEHTDAVAKHDQPGDKAHTEKGQHTKTFPKGDQADPVTSAAQDVDRNPLRDMIEQEQVQSAISAYEQA